MTDVAGSIFQVGYVGFIYIFRCRKRARRSMRARRLIRARRSECGISDQNAG